MLLWHYFSKLTEFIMISLRRLRLPRMRKRRLLIFIIAVVVFYFVDLFGLISELSQLKKSGGNLRHDRSFSKDKDNSKPPSAIEQISSHVKVEHELRTHGSVFRCKFSKKLISSDKVNDDYCDCPEDGADEFLTEACDNAVFHCKSSKTGFPSKIVSAWVNDGICDCCDGSDEWQEKTLISLPYNLQKKVGRYVSPCPKLC